MFRIHLYATQTNGWFRRISVNETPDDEMTLMMDPPHLKTSPEFWREYWMNNCCFYNKAFLFSYG